MKRTVSMMLVVPAACAALSAQEPDPQPKTPPVGKPSPTYPAPAAPKVDPAHAQLAKDYETAFNKGDVKALVALYIDDAMRLAENNDVLNGRAAIQKFYEASFAGSRPGTLTIRPGRTEMIAPDVAVVEGTYELSGTSVSRGVYVLTLVRQKGQWKLASAVPVSDTQ